MISRPVELFTPAAAGTIPHRANNQTGLPDFGPLLETGSHVEGAPGGEMGGKDAPSQSAGTAPQSQHQLPDRSLQVPGSMPVTASAHTRSEVAHIVAGAIGERTELASMRWGLRANAALSYLTTKGNAHGATTGSMSEDLAPPQTESSAPGQLFTFAAVDETAPAGDWLHSLQPLEAAPERELSSADSAPTMERTNPAPAATAASTAWPERLLRWLATPDGNGATAWIRDYQMSPSQAARMVDSLRSLAAQQGQQLHRIVLNGHELWRSASTQSNNERGQ